MKIIILTLAVIAVFSTSSLAHNHDTQSETCEKLSSCSSCLSRSYCSWCINKSRCTRQSCGNDNAIYHRRIKALLSGPQFCPRLVRSEEVAFQSGKTQIVVKLTQIHLYMAWRAWKCKIDFNGEEIIVNAALSADVVHCDPVVLSNNSDKPLEGSASVLWDNNKTLDGTLLFKVTL